jgi:hypothetical protein
LLFISIETGIQGLKNKVSEVYKTFYRINQTVKEKERKSIQEVINGVCAIPSPTRR